MNAQADGWRFEWRDSWDDVWSEPFLAQWRQLLSEDRWATVYQDPRVVRAWAETHGAAVGATPMFGWATDGAGRQVLVTWCIVTQRGRVASRRSLIHAGDPFFGYHNPLVGSDASAIDWGGFWSAARKTAGAAADQAIFRLVHPRYAAGRLATAGSERSPVLSLAGFHSLDDALAPCSAKHRGDVGRQSRHLSARGALAFQSVRGEGAGQATRDFRDRFVPAYAQHWRHRREGCMLDRPGVLAFLDRVVSEGVAGGWAHYATLSVDGEPIAWHIGLNFRDAIYWWVPAHEARWQEFSPGKILLARAIAHAIGDSVSDLHFLTGAQQYKLQWRPDVVELSAVQWHASSPRGAAFAWYDAGHRLTSRA